MQHFTKMRKSSKENLSINQDSAQIWNLVPAASLEETKVRIYWIVYKTCLTSLSEAFEIKKWQKLGKIPKWVCSRTWLEIGHFWNQLKTSPLPPLLNFMILWRNWKKDWNIIGEQIRHWKTSNFIQLLFLTKRDECFRHFALGDMKRALQKPDLRLPWKKLKTKIQIFLKNTKDNARKCQNLFIFFIYCQVCKLFYRVSTHFSN